MIKEIRKIADELKIAADFKDIGVVGVSSLGDAVDSIVDILKEFKVGGFLLSCPQDNKKILLWHSKTKPEKADIEKFIESKDISNYQGWKIETGDIKVSKLA